MVDRSVGADNSEFGTGNLTNISIDPNLISAAEATEHVYFGGNLNAGLETTTEVWSSGSAITEGAANATAATALNNLDQVSIPLVAGDTVEISGTNPDGTAVSATYTYAAGDTVQDLLDVINASFTGASAVITDGNFVLSDAVAGDSSTSISLSNGAANTGTVSWPNFVNTEAGFTATARTSTVVYDSLGGAHNIVIEFTKTTTPGQWTWETMATGDETITAGTTGTVQFDSAGNLTSFLLDGGAGDVTIDPGNGAAEMHLVLHAEDADGNSGISQYDSISTLNVREQDGRASGELVGLTIGRDGLISGSFSNGEIETLAKLAVAQFPNNTGLNDLGSSLYQASIASGDETILCMEEDSATAIISGALEASNVDLSKELTEMIITQKGFEANAKVISTANQLLDELIRLKR
jgi:flagellar hook protein FlgE